MLPSVLEAAPDASFDLPTVCAGWTVRDVIAHCGAALGQLIRGETSGFTPEENERDVASRRDWPLDRVIDELLTNYGEAAARIEQIGGAADGLGLGEWIHGGDIRDPIGAADPYASEGIELALALICERSKLREAPSVEVVVGGQSFDFEVGSSVARLRCDAPTFVRLVAGRAPDPDRFDQTGVDPSALLLFT